MRKQILALFTVIAAAGMFTSCSSDDDPVIPGSELQQKTYTAEDGLAINLDGASVAGQTVTFTPGKDGSATIAIAGESIDLGELISGAISKAQDTKVRTSSFIPGSDVVTIPVTLIGEASNASFSGDGESTYCTFKYSGKVSDSDFSLNVTDVKLKNTSIAGTYNTREFDNNFFNMLRVQWVSTKNAEIDLWGTTVPMPIKDIVRMALVMTQVSLGDNEEEKVPVAEALSIILKSVTLGEDGSVVATYLDTDKAGLPQTTSPKGIARYVVKEDGTLLLFLDVRAIIANTVAAAKSSRAVDVDAVLGNLIGTMAPMLANGVPVKYGPRIMSEDYDGNSELDPDENAVSFYLDQTVLLPILKIAAPILSDEEVVNAIVELASQDPDMAGMAGMLPGILKSLPAIINGTTSIEVGINLYK